MAKINKVDIPSAVQHRSKLDLSFDHVTTSPFLRVQPVMYRHMLRTESLQVHVNSTVRPAPIEVPFFGSCVQNLRAFFVPYRLVFPQWESFIHDNIGSNYNSSGLVSSPPLIGGTALTDLFFIRSDHFQLADVVTSGSFDYVIGSTNYKLRRKGRRFLTILRSLGYEILVSKSSHIYNALGLLALAKLYIDWYANQNYLNSYEILHVQQLFEWRDPVNPLVLTADNIFYILEVIYRCVYDTDDYITNAWDNPVSPNDQQFSNFTFIDPTSSGGAYVSMNANGSPEMVANSSYPDSIGTTYIHEALKRLTDYQRRHALAGALSINRLLAQYGIVTDNLKQQRSIYVGFKKIAIQSGSVMATADSSNGSSTSSTGDYAGAAFGHDSGVWDFKTDEEGVFFIVSTIIPQGNLVQGYDRNNRLMSKSDFFVEEFDALGTQAIEKGEVFVSRNLDSGGQVDMDYFREFGFSGRYAEKKRPKSFLTGDFSFPSVFVGGDSWHLFRMFSEQNFVNPDTNSFDINQIKHSLDFTMSGDQLQYYRIFQYTDDYLDPFYLFLHFDVSATAPCKPLFETYEFDSEAAKKVTIDQGAKVN